MEILLSVVSGAPHNPPARTLLPVDKHEQSIQDLVCFGSSCVTWADAFARTRAGASWAAALPSPPADRSPAIYRWGHWRHRLQCRHRLQRHDCNASDPRRCPTCAALDAWAAAGSPAFNVSIAWEAVPANDANLLRQLSYQTPAGGRLGWVPPVLQRLEYRALGKLPCSDARGEDSAVVRTFFINEVTGQPFAGGTFLEMGGFDGVSESQTWALERCLGWKGVLIEAERHNFAKLLGNRPSTLNLRLAACEQHTHLSFTDHAATFARQAGVYEGDRGVPTVSVTCGPLGDYLALLDVRSIDFFSLDVEGAELQTVRSLAPRLHSGELSIGVLMVEVRGDGQRADLMRELTGAGLAYVGQVDGRATASNDIISDVYVSMKHMQKHFPRSAALRGRTALPTARVEEKVSMRAKNVPD